MGRSTMGIRTVDGTTLMGGGEGRRWKTAMEHAMEDGSGRGQTQMAADDGWLAEAHTENMIQNAQCAREQDSRSIDRYSVRTAAP